MTAVADMTAEELLAALPPLLWDAEQAAKRLGGMKTANWLKTQARAGRIPYTPLGKTLAWSEKNLRDLVDQESRDVGSYGRRKPR